MKTYFMYGFSISMTKKQAGIIAMPGRDSEPFVKTYLETPEGKRQAKKLDLGEIKAELKEYGAWTSEELQDDKANLERIFWIAAGNIIDEIENKGR